MQKLYVNEDWGLNQEISIEGKPFGPGILKNFFRI